MYRDLWHYERVNLVDVIHGEGIAPSFVLALIEGIPAGSMIAADQADTPEYFGWDRQTAILADIYDALMLNTRASGNWDKKPPEFPPYPRPGAEKKKKNARKCGGVSALYARINGGDKNAAA